MTQTSDKLTAKDLSVHLHTAFKVVLESRDSFDLELVEIAEHNANPKIESFSAVFRGPLHPQMQQGIRKLEHRSLGVLELFLTPIAMDEKGLTYEAVVNRFRKQDS